MVYEFYFDEVLLPVTPSQLQMKTGNKNKTYTLINEGEINVLKLPSLTSISFDVLIPSVQYSFARYIKNEFKSATYFLGVFEKLKVEKKPFQFIVNRTLPNGKVLFDTNMKVSLEDYTIKEDAKNGFDLIVTVSLKQYRDYATKTCDVDFASLKPTVTVKKERATTNNAPSSTLPTTYKVQSGDTLWKIATKFYNNGSLCYGIYNANKDKVKNPNSINAGQVLTIPDIETAKKNNTAPKSSTSKSSTSKSSTTTVSYGVYNKKGVLLGTFASYNSAYSYYSSHGADATKLVIKNMSTGQVVK